MSRGFTVRSSMLILREFEQRSARVAAAAESGPVHITDHGSPS